MRSVPLRVRGVATVSEALEALAALTLAIVRLLVVICAAVAGAALAVALRLPPAAAALAGAALGAAAVGLELAVALGRDPASAARGHPRDGGKLLDTSAIIDGRIADVVTTGYLEGPAAGAALRAARAAAPGRGADPLRRNRGKRGFEILKRLQDLRSVEIVEADVVGVSDVDAKLVELARQRARTSSPPTTI